MSASAAAPLFADESAPGQVFLRLVQRASSDGITRAMSAMSTIVVMSPEQATYEVWKEDACLAAIQEAHTLIAWLEGAVGAVRRREARTLAPDLADKYEALQQQTAAWYRAALLELEQRLAFIRASEEVLDQHEPTFRALAQ